MGVSELKTVETCCKCGHFQISCVCATAVVCDEYLESPIDYTRIADYGTDPLELPTSGQFLNAAMLLLAREPNAIFLGQGVEYGGVATYQHLVDVPAEKRLEFPVAEELQLGASIGLAMDGWLPISIFPRMDFLLRAMDQLVSHLDKLSVMSRGEFNPKVIIRTRVGTKTPLDAGPQHTGRYTEAFKLMLTTVQVVEITKSEQIMPTYKAALASSFSTIMVEALP